MIESRRSRLTEVKKKMRKKCCWTCCRFMKIHRYAFTYINIYLYLSISFFTPIKKRERKIWAWIEVGAKFIGSELSTKPHLLIKYLCKIHTYSFLGINVPFCISVHIYHRVTAWLHFIEVTIISFFFIQFFCSNKWQSLPLSDLVEITRTRSLLRINCYFFSCTFIYSHWCRCVLYLILHCSAGSRHRRK